jgi:hypothetical protein
MGIMSVDIDPPSNCTNSLPSTHKHGCLEKSLLFYDRYKSSISARDIKFGMGTDHKRMLEFGAKHLYTRSKFPHSDGAKF